MCRCEKLTVQMITMGGNAEIELIDSMDPFSEGELPRVRRAWTDKSADSNRCRVVYHAAQEELESDRQSVWRRKGEFISSGN